MNDLIRHFAEFITVSSELERALLDSVSIHEFRKSDLVLEASEVCIESHFVQSGLMRLYFVEDDRQISEFFCGVNEWINSPRSFATGEVDIYYIDAIEDSQTYSLKSRDLGSLFTNFPEMERYSRLSMGGMLVQTMEHIRSLRFHTAIEKYEHFKRTYNDTHDRIPLGMIASYLGITQETLSRVRAQPRI